MNVDAFAYKRGQVVKIATVLFWKNYYLHAYSFCLENSTRYRVQASVILSAILIIDGDVYIFFNQHLVNKQIPSYQFKRSTVIASAVHPFGTSGSKDQRSWTKEQKFLLLPYAFSIDMMIQNNFNISDVKIFESG